MNGCSLLNNFENVLDKGYSLSKSGLSSEKGEDMDNKKIQWHPGFVAAMELEFADNKGDLEYEREYNLNTKPLEVDLLVIKKNASVHITNEIGEFFRGHNLMEIGRAHV